MNSEELIEFKRRLKEARDELESATAVYEELLGNCTHDICVKKYESKVCTICGKDFGWWCDKSPDNACHYFSNCSPTGRIVVLNNGREVPVPRETCECMDVEDETYDCCLFCYQPDERK